MGWYFQFIKDSLITNPGSHTLPGFVVSKLLLTLGELGSLTGLLETVLPRNRVPNLLFLPDLRDFSNLVPPFRACAPRRRRVYNYAKNEKFLHKNTFYIFMHKYSQK